MTFGTTNLELAPQELLALLLLYHDFALSLFASLAAAAVVSEVDLQRSDEGPCE